MRDGLEGSSGRERENREQGGGINGSVIRKRSSVHFTLTSAHFSSHSFIFGDKNISCLHVSCAAPALASSLRNINLPFSFFNFFQS